MYNYFHGYLSCRIFYQDHLQTNKNDHSSRMGLDSRGILGKKLVLILKLFPLPFDLFNVNILL